ncbi:MAG: N-acetyl-gamma-glutamyl-phosphate reductase [Myxococcales bacterium]|nr:N-acetyl-gamma-glutamyl-phosphate reductase [Polyangiaceae bacterium]MDW8250785.1 N-acetyl-gamma-glutamyl-phosphate reductase [Myxococcales bacterium]
MRGARCIANPGCHATAFLLLVRPLVEAKVLSPVFLLSATSLTGYSGGGKQMIARYKTGEDPKLCAPCPYALGLEHKHLPEMRGHGLLTRAPVFQPIVGNFERGLAVTIPLHLDQLAPGTTGATLQRIYEERYSGEPFVQVMPLTDPAALEVGFFDVQGCNDTNRVDLFVFANSTQALLMARLDNLGKGAGGAAVQNMNLCLGLPEQAGLS